MTNFSHLDAAGQVNMVDVSGKADSERVALAEAKVLLSEDLMQMVREQNIAKGDLLATARIAGIQAAKKCADLIPLCHPLPLSKVSIDIEELSSADPGATMNTGLRVQAMCKTTGKTGVEMEALTAASVAALTIYDMCKAADKGIVIEQVRLLQKQGGKSGNWVRDND